MIPYGFARGGEEMYRNTSMYNQAVLKGETDTSEFAKKCYDKLAWARERSCHSVR
jgi:hypothetical protein